MRYVLLAALILVADSNKIPPIIDNGKLTCRPARIRTPEVGGRWLTLALWREEIEA